MEQTTPMAGFSDATRFLRPGVTWTRIGAAKIQLRSPDGRHLTFDREIDSIERVLIELRAGATLESIRRGVPTPGQTFVDKFLDLLSSRALMIERLADSTDSFSNLVQITHELTRRGAGELVPRPAQFQVEGRGWVRNAVARALQIDTSSVAVGNQDRAAPVLMVVCADSEDVAYCRQMNEVAAEQGAQLTFIRWASPNVLLGPYTVRGQSACFECYFSRLAASANFLDEMLANADSTHAGNEASEPLLSRLVEFLAVQHTSAIAHGLLGHVEPNTIYSLDVLTLMTGQQRFLRVPRCGVCGRLRNRDHKQAIRSI